MPLVGAVIDPSPASTCQGRRSSELFGAALARR
jgi:hypothetical protein